MVLRGIPFSRPDLGGQLNAGASHLFKPAPRPGRSLVRRLADLMLALVLLGPAAVGLAALSGIGHRWVDLLAQFPAAAIWIALAGLAVAAGLRLRVAGLAAGLATALLAAALWGQIVPPRPAPAAGGETLTVYVANLHEENGDLARIAASIAAADADVVVLVEVGPAAAADLDRLLPDHPHRAPARIMARGNLVASRNPLQALPGRADGLAAQGARVQTVLGPVSVFATHLTRPWPFQYQWGQITQVMALGDRMAASGGPVIAAGDFNSVSTARIGRQMRDLGLAPAPAWPGTWPANVPAPARITIDHLWASPELAIVSRRPGRPTGSDHSPVIVELARAQTP
jgi:endonuclease/exonuclease/phosphatase (EEP) superfamily protein YafD